MATASGRPVASVLAEPFWLVLWTFQHLSERLTERALEGRRARLDTAYLTALAVNQPDGLDTERKAVQDAVERFEFGGEGIRAHLEAARARGLRMAQAITTDGVLLDAPAGATHG